VLDGEFRSGDLRFSFIGVHTGKREARSDFGGKAALEWSSSGFYARTSTSYIGEYFDVSPVGFYPVEGEKWVYILGGPILHNKGPFKRMRLSFMGVWVKELKEPRSEYRISNDFDFNFVKN